MKILYLDHFVLTVSNMEKAIQFYRDVLGFEHVEFGQKRHALVFGSQKINLHENGKEFEPKAKFPTPGSADLCFIAETPIEEILAQLEPQVIEGPVVGFPAFPTTPMEGRGLVFEACRACFHGKGFENPYPSLPCAERSSSR